jgi:hypothetical protein
MNWFKRHLNWTFVFGMLASFLFCMLLYGVIILIPTDTSGIQTQVGTAKVALDTATANLSKWDKYKTPSGLNVTYDQYIQYQQDYKTYSGAFERYNQVVNQYNQSLKDALSSHETLYYSMVIPLNIIWLCLLGGWILKRKGRSLWHILWIFFGWWGPIIFLCLSNKRELGESQDKDGFAG